jgi:hypothetical protein
MKKQRSLEKIEALTEEQREQLAEWVETESLDKCIERAAEEFGVEIARTTMNRFRKRCEVTSYVMDTPESARARAEMINAAATGKPNFSQATVDLMEKEAFELALAHGEEGEMERLKGLFGLVQVHRNATVRERLAAVQELKAKARLEELELKKGLAARKQCGTEGAKEDALGPFARNLEGLEERSARQFGFQVSEPTPDKQDKQKEAQSLVNSTATKLQDS